MKQVFMCVVMRQILCVCVCVCVSVRGEVIDMGDDWSVLWM